VERRSSQEESRGVGQADPTREYRVKKEMKIQMQKQWAIGKLDYEIEQS
jgi:hypothetical protein